MACQMPIGLDFIRAIEAQLLLSFPFALSCFCVDEMIHAPCFAADAARNAEQFPGWVGLAGTGRPSLPAA